MDIRLERAKTGRGDCYGCKKTIDQGKIRANIDAGLLRHTTLIHRNYCANCAWERITIEIRKLEELRRQLVAGDIQ
jgi:hypothetical protein